MATLYSSYWQTVDIRYIETNDTLRLSSTIVYRLYCHFLAVQFSAAMISDISRLHTKYRYIGLLLYTNMQPIHCNTNCKYIRYLRTLPIYISECKITLQT